MFRLASFVGLACLVAAATARASDVTGTLSLQGQIVFAAPIADINPEDLTVGVKTDTEATGNGEQCEITATTGDNADVTGAYPDAGTVTATITISRGGPQVPDGNCIVTVQASGTDGVEGGGRHRHGLPALGEEAAPPPRPLQLPPPEGRTELREPVPRCECRRARRV
jgi:hypothetical protein